MVLYSLETNETRDTFCNGDLPDKNMFKKHSFIKNKRVNNNEIVFIDLLLNLLQMKSRAMQAAPIRINGGATLNSQINGTYIICIGKNYLHTFLR